MRQLDVNAMLAIAWPNHPFHVAARQWFSGIANDGWGTCQLVDAAFIRLSSMAAVVAEPRRPAEAASLLLQLKEVGAYCYVTDAALDGEVLRRCLERCHGHNQVNDAFLVALAQSHEATLCTYDQRLAVLADSPETVEVLTV